MALVTRIPGLYTASGVLPHALFLSLSFRGGGEEGSKSKARLHGALAESELREEPLSFLLILTERKA